MSAAQLLRSRRDDLLRVARLHRASNLRIFGSAARGEDRADSDIDLLVDFDPDATLLDLIALQSDIETLLGRQADVLTPQSVSPFLRDRILSEAIPL